MTELLEIYIIDFGMTNYSNTEERQMSGKRFCMMVFFMLAVSSLAMATDTVVTNIGGHTQIWFLAGGFDAIEGEIAPVPDIIEQELASNFEIVDQSLTQNPLAFYGDSPRQSQEDWWVEYNFDLPQGGEWYIWSRAAQNSPTGNSLGSHWVFVVGDNDTDYPPPGEISLDYFLLELDRLFGDRFSRPGEDEFGVYEDVWEWVGIRANARGINDTHDPRFPLPKLFKDGANSMRIYERESGAPSVQFEIFVLSDVDYVDFIPTDAMAAEALDLTIIGNVDRSFPVETITPGEALEGVQLALNIPEGQSYNVTVTEMVPAGWVPANPQASAGSVSIDNSNIVWTLENVSTDQTLTYDITPPSNAIFGVFSGDVVFDDTSTLIGGANTIQKELSFAGVNDSNPSVKPLVNGEAFFEETDAYLFYDTDEPPFEILIDESRANNLYTNTSIGGDPEILKEIHFYFEVTDPGVYRAIASVRNPTNSDDSWFVAMDDDVIDPSDTDSYRFQGATHLEMNDDEFHKMWVQTDGIEDLSWDLSAGVHYLRFGAREDGSHLDWVLITNDLEQDPEAVEPPITPVHDFMLY